MSLSGLKHAVSEGFVEIIVLAITGIIAAITVLLRKKISVVLLEKVETIFKLKIYSADHHMTKEDYLKAKDVISKLSEIRIQSKADRVCLFQFHNGAVFNTMNPIWRLTCTHEVVDNVLPIQHHFQGTLASSLLSLIAPLWEDDDELSDYPGIIKVSPRACSCPDREKCKYPHGVYFYRTNGLTHGYCHGVMEAHNIKYALLTPLVDGNDNIVGFIVLHYCWDDANVQDIENYAEELCRRTEAISYILSKL